jgi:hypothetical protein
VLFGQKESLVLSSHHQDNYLAQSVASNRVNVHFLARYYTWSI